MCTSIDCLEKNLREQLNEHWARVLAYARSEEGNSPWVNSMYFYIDDYLSDELFDNYDDELLIALKYCLYARAKKERHSDTIAFYSAL